MKIKSTIELAKLKLLYVTISLIVMVFSMSYFSTNVAHGAVANPTPTAKITFTFDDGLQSAAAQARPILARYGLTGTSYVTTGCVGMTTIPNTCRADTDARYMTWTQVKQLQAAGWEIGSHTVTHPYLASSDASDGQPDVLTPAQVSSELSQSKAILASQGITANALSTPYGDYSNATLAEIAKHYTSHRGFADQNVNNWPYSDYLLNNMPVQSGVTVAQVKAKIDAAIANKQWLILTFHDIKLLPSSDPDDYQYGSVALEQIASYVRTKRTAGLIAPVNISQGLVTSDVNLLPNSSFDDGIAGGWTTDLPASVTKDTLNNGSVPSAINSIKLTSSSANSHLFTPGISVNSNTSYLIKSFLNVSTILSGEVGFYIDEFDASGRWVSGQYKNGERSVFVEEYNIPYKPTSSSVKIARLQVIASANSGIAAYIDNMQWFPLVTTTPPTQTNLVANGNFDNGIADGWTTDSSTTITKDTGNHGSPNNPVNSILMKSTTKNTHLSSPKVTVDGTKNYTLQSYLDLQQVSDGGEIGFYIDEFDANGNWVSGQYKTGIRSVSKGEVGFQYKPSSTNVKSASLQVIVTANETITAYYDDLRWYLEI